MNQLTLLEIADLLADLFEFEDVTAGCVDSSKSRTIGVYQRSEFVPRECIGTDSSYETSKIRILVHWTDNPATAEKQAFEVAELFQSFDNISTENHIIKFAEVKAVRNIGKDEKGICEYVVDTDIIYTKKES